MVYQDDLHARSVFTLLVSFFSEITIMEYSDDKLKDIIRKDESLAGSSKETILGFLDSLQKNYAGPRTLLWVLTNPKSLVDKLPTKTKSQHSLYGLTNAPLMIYLREPKLKEKYPEAYQGWTEARKQFQDNISDAYESNVATEKYEKGSVPWATFLEKRDSLSKGSLKRLLLCMYSMIPPTRRDYGDVTIFEDVPETVPEGINYLVLCPSGSFIGLQEYKTVKDYGHKKIDLPSELVEEIRASLKDTPRKHLFVGRDNQPFKLANSYGKWVSRTLQKIFDKPMTINTIRHMFVSENVADKCVKERKKIASDMCHSLQTQMIYAYIHPKESKESPKSDSLDTPAK